MVEQLFSMLANMIWTRDATYEQSQRLAKEIKEFGLLPDIAEAVICEIRGGERTFADYQVASRLADTSDKGESSLPHQKEVKPKSFLRPLARSPRWFR